MTVVALNLVPEFSATWAWPKTACPPFAHTPVSLRGSLEDGGEDRGSSTCPFEEVPPAGPQKNVSFFFAETRFGKLPQLKAHLRDCVTDGFYRIRMVLDLVDCVTLPKRSLPAGPARLGMEVADDQPAARCKHPGQCRYRHFRRWHVTQRKSAHHDVRATVFHRQRAAVRHSDSPQQSRLGSGFGQHSRTQVKARCPRPSLHGACEPAPRAA